MSRKWIEFGIGPKGSTKDRIHISLSKDGNFRLNKKAFEALGRPAALKLMFEERTGTIGFAATSPDMPNAYSTNYKEKGAGCRFSCREFLKTNKIPYDVAVTFHTARIEDGVLLLEIKYRTPLPRTSTRDKS